jgi:hypothetical protein
MLQHLTGGIWGVVLRRPLEAASRNIWLVLLLFLPIVWGMKYLYSGNGAEFGWMNSPKTGEHALTAWQQGYLTTHGYLARAVLYFAVWFLLVWLFNAFSRMQDANPDDRIIRLRFKRFSGPGIILYVLTMTFAAIDWVMSISPHWASTIYGFIFVAGQAIAAMCLMILTVIMLSRFEPYAGFIRARHLHDLGKLLFAFNMLWAYFDFSQLLIIWSGNQPEEITFFRSRLYGGWGVVAVIILIFHFFVPFFILLSEDVKRNAKLLPKIAVWLIFMRLVDLFWMTRPEFTSRAVPTWLDIVLPLALGGLWLGFFAFNLKQMPLLPLGDPKLEEAIEQHDR